MRWLTLLMSLPPTLTRHRVGVWRKLQRMGAVKLRGAAWILPETAETTELFQWLRSSIKDRRVTLIGEIVHEADLHDGKFTRQVCTPWR